MLFDHRDQTAVHFLPMLFFDFHTTNVIFLSYICKVSNFQSFRFETFFFPLKYIYIYMNITKIKKMGERNYIINFIRNFVYIIDIFQV